MKKEKIDIFIITHNSLLDGPINYYENYLLRNNRDVILLSHPLDNYKNRKTVLYKNKNEIYSKERKELGLINLFLDYLISFKISFKYNINIFIGANNFDTFFGILLKKIQKKPNKIVYFASDFSEERFSNKILNKIYFSIEKFVLKNADIVISNTKRSENKRIEFGLKNEKSILISNGVFLKNMSFKQKNINKKNFLFIGSVTKEHGLYDLLNTIHPIINQLTLIGSGDDWQRVLDLCKKKNINLEFHYKKDHDFTINYLQKFSGIGLAPYNLESKWTYYCSPLKVNEYIACGVPVLMSDVPEIANTISVEKLGITYNDLNLDIINNKLIDFNISDYNLKAEKFYKIYNYDSLYKKINI